MCFRLYVRLKVARVPGLDDLFVALYLVGILLPPKECLRADVQRKISTSIASVVFLVSKYMSLETTTSDLSLTLRVQLSSTARAATFFCFPSPKPRNI